MLISGIAVKGLGIAKYTIPKQKKIFSKKIDSVYEYKNGTINLRLNESIWGILKYDYYFEKVAWDKDGVYPAEDFGFIKINKLIHKDLEIENWGYIYFPTKSPHFGKNNQVELLGKNLFNLNMGDAITLEVPDDCIV